jgi:hypothetical protein
LEKSKGQFKNEIESLKTELSIAKAMKKTDEIEIFYYFCLISSYESSLCKPCFRNHNEFFENTIAITILVLRPSLVT